MTGIEKHPKNNHLCKMKQVIVLFLGKYFPGLSHQNHSKNKGRILITGLLTNHRALPDDLSKIQAWLS